MITLGELQTNLTVCVSVCVCEREREGRERVRVDRVWREMEESTGRWIHVMFFYLIMNDFADVYGVHELMA